MTKDALLQRALVRRGCVVGSQVLFFLCFVEEAGVFYTLVKMA